MNSVEKLFSRKIIKTLFGIEIFMDKLINFLAIAENNGVHPKYKLTKYADFFLNNISPENSVLDIGCGIGYVAYIISEKAKKVTGVDIENKNISVAKNKFARNNLNFIAADATTYDFNEKYDAIILSNVLEHIDERVKFLSGIKNLAPKILIRVPMINRDWSVLYKKELGAKYLSDDGHFIEYTIDSFQEEMEKAGLKIESYSIQFGEIWAVIKK